MIDRPDTAFERLCDWSYRNSWWIAAMCAWAVVYVIYKVVWG
jgi:hypothetical protein